MRIAIGSDHAGFELKEEIKKHIEKLGHEYKDFGTFGKESVDYPDFASKVAKAVSKKIYDRGILICGSGIGMSMCANKVPGIRAALCYSIETAKLSRKHNDANVLTLGARLTNPKLAKKIVEVWLQTEFEGGRHKRRVDKIMEMEKERGN
jgi:ribose 5-phosphate isomerase B